MSRGLKQRCRGLSTADNSCSKTPNYRWKAFSIIMLGTGVQNLVRSGGISPTAWVGIGMGGKELGRKA